MGLNERRKIEELQDTTFPGRVKEIEEICGKAIPYEVDWESLSDDAEGLNFIDNLSCHRLNMALRGICQDDMGKQAVRDGLKLIKLKNVKEKAAMKMSFAAGVLEMHCAYALKTDGMFGDREIEKLEAVSKPPARRCEVSGCRWQGATTSSIRGNTARRSDAVQRLPDARNARARF